MLQIPGPRSLFLRETAALAPPSSPLGGANLFGAAGIHPSDVRRVASTSDCPNLEWPALPSDTVIGAGRASNRALVTLSGSDGYLPHEY
jgi:hypothetical protein